jgi:putative addiction module killer protein
MMLDVRMTVEFRRWFSKLRDVRGKAMIAVRIDRLAYGYAGDVRRVGNGISEMRIDHGPGYRVYFVRRNDCVIVLLCAGDKSSQSKDISRACRIAENLED